MISVRIQSTHNRKVVVSTHSSFADKIWNLGGGGSQLKDQAWWRVAWSPRVALVMIADNWKGGRSAILEDIINPIRSQLLALNTGHWLVRYLLQRYTVVVLFIVCSHWPSQYKM